MFGEFAQRLIKRLTEDRSGGSPSQYETPAMIALGAAIVRTQAAIAALCKSVEGEPGADFCCYDCCLGDDLWRLERKLERQEAWLAVLRAKHYGEIEGSECASKRYTELVHAHIGLVRGSSRPSNHSAIAARVYTTETWWSAWLATWGRIGSEYTTAHWRRVFGPPGTARGW